MCSCCADRTVGPRARRRSSSSAAPQVAIALCLVATALLAAPSVRAQSLPVDDNELIVGGSLGPLFVEEIDAQDRADLTLRVGLAMELFVGLMRRQTSWLDLELALGASALWLGGEGFVQAAPTGTKQRHFLPGAHLRAGARALASDDGLGASLLVGLAASIFAAPASGSFAQVGLELGLGLDALRDRETHLGLELVYHLPLVDELPDEPGMALRNDTHRVVLRVAYGF